MRYSKVRTSKVRTSTETDNHFFSNAQTGDLTNKVYTWIACSLCPGRWELNFVEKSCPVSTKPSISETLLLVIPNQSRWKFENVFAGLQTFEQN